VPNGRLGEDLSMAFPSESLSSDDWLRICDALRYLGRDLHHRSFAVTAERRELLWQEMDRCLELANRIADGGGDDPPEP